jgi:hypothetical protein
MPWVGNEGKRMAGVPHSEKSAGFHSSGLPIKNDSSEIRVICSQKNITKLPKVE